MTGCDHVIKHENTPITYAGIGGATDTRPHPPVTGDTDLVRT